MKYILKRVGFNNPTEIQRRDRIGNMTTVITHGLDIETTVKEWRDHFNKYDKFTVYVDVGLLSSIEQKTLISSHSVYELFCRQGIIFKVMEWSKY